MDMFQGCFEGESNRFLFLSENETVSFFKYFCLGCFTIVLGSLGSGWKLFFDWNAKVCFRKFKSSTFCGSLIGGQGVVYCESLSQRTLGVFWL